MKYSLTFKLMSAGLGFVLLLSACNVLRRNPSSLDTFPLPVPAELPCCWQSQESIELAYNGGKTVLTAVILVDQLGLTLVVFDPLGRRFMQVIQRGVDVTTTLLVEHDKVPLKWILPAVYLVHMDQQRWPHGAEAWIFEQEQEGLTLYYAGQKSIQLSGRSRGVLPELGQQRQLNFIDAGLILTITTLDVSPL